MELPNKMAAFRVRCFVCFQADEDSTTHQLQYSNTPILQYSNTPILPCSRPSLLLYSCNSWLI